MAKITAVIDIGSNSARMVVFERTSRYGFHLLHEAKSKVRISEGAYDNGGNLQEVAILRAMDALKDFIQIAKSYNATKILALATSAVRDAPNSQLFLKRVKDNLSLSIKVIDGEEESYLGALAALNLLPLQTAITVDIGGGSTELALIRDSKIITTLSLPLGTVRLKELYFDKKAASKDVALAIKEKLLPFVKEFSGHPLIAIGGTNRAIATAIMHSKKHPIDSVHGFTVTTKEVLKLTEKILEVRSSEELRKYKVKEERFDVIKEGTMIIKTIIEMFKPSSFTASGAGVREGAYLRDILGKQLRFPQGINPSVQSLADRFLPAGVSKNMKSTALTLFDALQDHHKLETTFKNYLSTATQLSLIGRYVNFYNSSTHTFYLLINALSYGFSHTDRMMIANIIRPMNTKGEKSGFSKKIRDYPIPFSSLCWLEFILNTTKALHTIPNENVQITLSLSKETITIASLSLQRKVISEALGKVVPPTGITLIYK